MNVTEAIERRRSVRHYRPDPIPDDDAEQAAELDATGAVEREPSAVEVRRREATEAARESLASVCSYRRRTGEIRIQRFIAEAPVVVVACGFESEANVFYKRDGRCPSRLGRSLAMAACENVTDAQSTLLVDLASAFSHLMLAAMDEGVGTCWVMGVDEQRVKQILGIPEDARAPMLMTLGYPAPERDGRRGSRSTRLSGTSASPSRGAPARFLVYVSATAKRTWRPVGQTGREKLCCRSGAETGRARIPPILYWVSSVSGLPLVALRPLLAFRNCTHQRLPARRRHRRTPWGLNPSFHPSPGPRAFGWSSLCCAWPSAGLSPGAARLAVSAGWSTPAAARREGVGKFL